jgi:Zn-finger nucleic acid-binding protein
MKCPTCTDTPLVMAERQGVVMPYPQADRDVRYGYADRDACKRKKSWLHEIFD